MSDITGASAAFARLNGLIRCGYVPELGTSAPADTIFLHHPKTGVPGLILYADGLIASREGGFQIATDAPRDFADLLHRTPKPTATQAAMNKPAGAAIFLAIGAVLFIGLVVGLQQYFG